jgi:hypothetical protein
MTYHANHCYRTLVGSNKKRVRMLLVGTVGGFWLGWILCSQLSEGAESDVSDVCAGLGGLIGWGVAWLFARHIPLKANGSVHC